VLSCRARHGCLLPPPVMEVPFQLTQSYEILKFIFVKYYNDNAKFGLTPPPPVYSFEQTVFPRTVVNQSKQHFYMPEAHGPVVFMRFK